MNTNNNDPKGKDSGSNGGNRPFKAGTLIVGTIACAVTCLVAPAAIPVVGLAATIMGIIEGWGSGNDGDSDGSDSSCGGFG
jgi:hypothetical protein